APSLVSVRGGETVAHRWCQGGGNGAHRWCQWEEIVPIVGVSGRNSVPSLVSVGGIVPHHWYQWEVIVPHHWYLVGGLIVPHHWYQWEEY
ncbi:unnamed protein product, partial [Staurois parvus]